VTILSKPNIQIKALLSKVGSLPSETNGFYFYQRGRDALLVAIRALRLKPTDTIIVPAYICETAIMPIRSFGYKIKFIDVQANMQLDPIKVLKMVDVFDAKALIVIHYFGLPAHTDKLITLLRPRGVKIIEDCCHNFLGNPGVFNVGSGGDVTIFSMRKTLPIPDGGALRFNTNDFDKSVLGGEMLSPPSIRGYVSARFIEAFVMSIGWPNIYSEFIDKIKKFNITNKRKFSNFSSFDLEPKCQSPSYLLQWYLSRENLLKDIRVRIISNYTYLVDGLLKLGIEPYMHKLPLNCTPQWFLCNDPHGDIVPWLRAHKVGASHWPGEELPIEVTHAPLDYPQSSKFNSNLALIPIHQNIELRQIKLMLTLLGKLVRSRRLK